MPNGSFHKGLGALAGAATSACLSSDRQGLDRLAEVVGGLVGGWIGGAMPDIIDPAISPRHRCVGHAVAPAGLVAISYASNLVGWQTWLRRYADHFIAEAEASCDEAVRSNKLLAATACSLAAGLIAGFLAGYFSHLATDALTPNGLPIFGSRFG